MKQISIEKHLSENQIKGRSVRSKEKIADALMNLSTSIWAVIIFIVTVIPLAAVIKMIMTDQGAADLYALGHGIGLAYFLIILSMIVTGVFIALNFRKKALDIYDSLERYHF